MCGFGTPVFSHFCPEAFGRGKRIVESGGAQSVPAPGTAESRCPVEGRLINPYHRTSDIIYLNETLGWEQGEHPASSFDLITGFVVVGHALHITLRPVKVHSQKPTPE